ncbi:DUF5052 domain-containing protein [Staphylococcus equorum]|uniref:DUF5052 domain-containing protein n=1 Tax=Staphylococcus equorum TaxID=246432 RepID=A0A9X4R1Y2_9STAP|nr:DUF5052 domain-containing protein [Staphylococcus equorum]MDG0860382.1 DUF5052 domain-containing protein [Staphylococcus equorum]
MKKKTTKGIIASLALVSVVGFTAGCESFERAKKDFKSEHSGGLERTVQIINNQGDVVKEYNGKFDVTADENRIKFIKDNKSYLIYTAKTDTVIVEEK